MLCVLSAKSLAAAKKLPICHVLYHFYDLKLLFGDCYSS